MSNYDLVALERDNGKCVALHEISRPGWDEDGFYRASLTSEAFKYSEMRRRFGKNPPWNHKPLIRWFSVQNKDVWTIQENSTNKIMSEMGLIKYRPEYHDASIIKHESIWEFYKHIGYDYKRKKYL